MPWAGPPDKKQSGKGAGGINQGEVKGEWTEERQESSGYTLLDGGVKLQTSPTPYLVNPKNNEDLTDAEVIKEVTLAFETWDSFTSTNLFKDSTNVTEKSEFERDNQNVISFGPLEESDALSRTKVWHEDGKVLEFDIVLNSGYDWGIDPDGEGGQKISEYDVRNIMVHEA